MAKCLVPQILPPVSIACRPAILAVCADWDNKCSAHGYNDEAFFYPCLAPTSTSMAPTHHCHWVRAASDGSLRKEIFTNWQKLGLKSEPDVGDNGECCMYRLIILRRMHSRRCSNLLGGTEALRAHPSQPSALHTPPQRASRAGRQDSMPELLFRLSQYP